MEILNNFNSIYFFIIFVIIEVFMFFILIIITKEQKNKINFYVTKFGNTLVLWFGKPQYNGYEFESNKITVKIMAYKSGFKDFGLNPNNFDDMKIGEIREVFINLEN